MAYDQVKRFDAKRPPMLDFFEPLNRRREYWAEAAGEEAVCCEPASPARFPA